jgi:pseudouridine-5'-phosphate glycosidase
MADFCSPELQETLGVNVTTIGETNDFPAFYSPKSGFKVRSWRLAWLYLLLNAFYRQSSFFVQDASQAASLLRESSSSSLISESANARS